jgi:hypothetical protein
MAEELYVNKNGFKCVKSQLAKTEGRDPQEYENIKRMSDSPATLKAEAAKLKVRVPEYAEN